MVRFTAAALAFALPCLAQADAPNVVTDIAPVHSLVSMVMDGVGTPHLLLPANVSPHGYSMRPSDARSLQNADVLVWIGPDLTPWLAEAKSALGPASKDISLLDADGTVVLPTRSVDIAALIEDDGHDHGDDKHDHGHGDEDDAHEDAHASEHDHDHGGTSRDPHAWLHPENARIWLGVIASALAEVDAENAGTYRTNAAAALEQIDIAELQVSALLANTSETGFAVYHDAFQYFEVAFDLTAFGALTETDAAQPSVRRAAALRDAIADGHIACIFAEPQFANRALKAVSDGAEVAVLDPLGGALDEGPSLYPRMLHAIGEAIADC